MSASFPDPMRRVSDREGGWKRLKLRRRSGRFTSITPPRRMPAFAGSLASISGGFVRIPAGGALVSARRRPKSPGSAVQSRLPLLSRQRRTGLPAGCGLVPTGRVPLDLVLVGIVWPPANCAEPRNPHRGNPQIRQTLLKRGAAWTIRRIPSGAGKFPRPPSPAEPLPKRQSKG